MLDADGARCMCSASDFAQLLGPSTRLSRAQTSQAHSAHSTECACAVWTCEHGVPGPDGRAGRPTTELSVLSGVWSWLIWKVSSRKRARL